jgi:hypothetical protein
MQFIRKVLGRWSDYQELYALLTTFFSFHTPIYGKTCRCGLRPAKP